MNARQTQWIVRLILIGVLTGHAGAAGRDQAPEWVDRYNVVWDSPSGSSAGSMPLGNGDIGLNVWVEQDGDLLFYISKTDAWSEIGRLLKLGRVRVRFTPNPFVGSAPFRQTLHPRRGEIEIRAGEAAAPVSIRLWVDANHPLAHLECAAARPFAMQVSLETWRDQALAFTNAQDKFSAWHVLGPAEEAADTIWPTKSKRIIWFHRNPRSLWALTLAHQKMDAFAAHATDPLLNRTFGALITGDGFVKWNDRTLTSGESAMRHVVSIVALTRQTATPEEYVRALQQLARDVAGANLERQRRAHQRWWNDFWNRSWILVRIPPSSRVERKILPTGLPLRIGADSEGRNLFTGAIDEVYIWRRALRPAEVAAHAGGQKPVQDEACVAAWDFEDASSNAWSSRVGAKLVARAVGRVETGEGRRGRGLWLDGRGYLEAPNHPHLDMTDALSIEAWIAPSTDQTARIVDTSRAGTALGYCLDLFPANTLRAILAPSSLGAQSPLGTGQWSHVATTFDARTGEHRLFVNGEEVAAASLTFQDQDQVSRAYVLQRFLNACGGRGAFPIKFNGSIFTFDMPETWGAAKAGDAWQADADYRRWGGGYWFQNTRLTYWPMLASGDFDLMQPFFRMYLDALALARERTRVYYGHGGAFFPETIWFWGSYQAGDSGGEKPGEIRNAYIRHYYSGNLELIAMMLDYYQYTQDSEFLRRDLVPLANEVLTFYLLHYPYRDQAGRFRLDPSQALETWQKAVNPANEIAGLQWVLDGLLALPEGLTTPAQRAGWMTFQAILPPLPVRKDEQGRQYIAAAGKVLEAKRNAENPELYAVFPFRLYGVGKPDLETARQTFQKRLHLWGGGWQQNEIHAAYLGLAAEAAPHLLSRLMPTRTYRFPAFWGPNMDWVPDQDHGSVGLMALQTMLMQCEGRRILLFPAWPKEWDVEFKLCAPFKTTVAGVFRNGRLERLDVAPRYRRRDVEVLDPQAGAYKSE